MPDEPMPVYPGKDLEAMSFARNYHRWIVDEFEPYLGAKVAEVGAGVGSVSRMLLQKNSVERLVAFEPSRNMFPRLEAELRHEWRSTAVNGFFGPSNAADGFDSIVYINVLEHIKDDRAELSHAFGALKPGGHVLLFVPALAWLYSEFDREVGHCRRYGKRGLVRVVRDAGFAVERVKYFDMPGILPWYLNFVLLRNRMSGEKVSLYDRFVVPVARFVERVIPPPIGKSLLLIGKKG